MQYSNIHVTDTFFFTYKDMHFTLFPFMQIQDIDVIFLIQTPYLNSYTSSLFKLLIFTRGTNIRPTPNNSSCITIISKYAERNHYNVVNGEVLRFGNVTLFFSKNQIILAEAHCSFFSVDFKLICPYFVLVITVEYHISFNG